MDPKETPQDQEPKHKDDGHKEESAEGAWCEGFGFHFAVADADMKKDTNNNIELLARLMEQLYCAWGALPLSIAIIQDNTARACKNQKIVMWPSSRTTWTS